MNFDKIYNFLMGSLLKWSVDVAVAVAAIYANYRQIE